MTEQPPAEGPEDTSPPSPPPEDTSSPAEESSPSAEAASPPPPPPGGYPPPPPSSGGYAPPPPGPAVRGLPPQAYTTWLTRVLAFLIDAVPFTVIVGIGLVVLVGTQETACITDISPYDVEEFCATGFSAVGLTAFWLAVLAGLIYLVWNYGYLQGVNGSSAGKSVLDFRMVSENTGRPIGFGRSVVRELAHIVDAAILGIGFLFPLWDAKRQTLADKIMRTVCLPN